VTRVLVVDDELAIRRALAANLKARGYDVDAAETGEQALDLAARHHPDVVLLDLGLPDIDGIEVCQRLRRWYRNPIVVVSADGDEDRKVAALDDGADDYLTKPFSMRELLARVGVALRHRRLVAATVDPALVEVGDLRVDIGAHTAVAGGQPLRLSRKEFALLALLARNCGRVLTQDFLLSRVWHTTDPARSESLRAHVNQVRRKLGDGPQRPRVLNEPGVGYRLAHPDALAVG
jgi:two-component system, OmpR family, KDP operon response regulator KdpE